MRFENLKIKSLQISAKNPFNKKQIAQSPIHFGKKFGLV